MCENTSCGKCTILEACLSKVSYVLKTTLCPDLVLGSDHDEAFESNPLRMRFTAFELRHRYLYESDKVELTASEHVTQREVRNCQIWQVSTLYRIMTA